MLLILQSCFVWNSVKEKPLAPFRAVGRVGSKILVEFNFDAPPDTKSVHLAGAFNNWTAPGQTIDPLKHPKNIIIPMMKDPDSGIWKAVFPIEPGKYPFKYVIDGNIWKNDPRTIYIHD